MPIQFVDRIPTYPGRIKFTKEDGTVIYGVWERADNPTVEGTPLNAATLNTMQADIGLLEDKTLYVSTTGSDSTGDGSQAKPYATFAKALSTIPNNLNGHYVYLHVGNGTYNEELRVTNFYGGWIYLASGTYTVKRLMIEEAFVNLTDANITVNGQNSVTYGLSVLWNSNFRTAKNITIQNVTTGVHVDFGAYFNSYSSTLTITNTTTGVLCQNGARCVLGTVAGSNNATGIAAYAGGLVSFFNKTMSVTTSEYVTDSGGRVYSGAQGGAPAW